MKQYWYCLILKRNYVNEIDSMRTPFVWICTTPCANLNRLILGSNADGETAKDHNDRTI